EIKDKLLPQLEKPPLSNDPSWKQFKQDLKSYLEISEDPRRYATEGFEKFRVVDTELDDLLTASAQKQEQIFREAKAIEQDADRSIRLWSFIALLVGIVVVAGTIWEVQRRFRQMKRSMNEARRERVFTNQLLEAIVNAVAAIDGEDRLRSANAAFFRIFPKASIGASVHEKFANEDVARMLEAATATQVTQGTYRGRWRCRLDGGEDKTF